MIRTQIQLTEPQYRDLKQWAARHRISLAEAVRRCVADRLAAERAEPDRSILVREALSVIGKYADPSGPSDVARHHDAELVKAYLDR
jgi:hypothetical protein